MVDGIPKAPLFSPKALEAWFTLMAEAVRGTAEAQEAFKALTEASTKPEELQRWQAQFMPLAGAATKPEAFEEWLEEWWRMMGVVPRSRYLDLLERYETLRLRLEKAEETIRSLRAMIGQGQEQEAQKLVNLWETMLQESLKAQAEWMRAWDTSAKEEKKDDPESGP
jgi:hypothetical protein